jgi:hypothetical protein
MPQTSLLAGSQITKVKHHINIRAPARRRLVRGNCSAINIEMITGLIHPEL